MSLPFQSQLIGATRLVREGRLGEATSLLQRALKGEAGAAPEMETAPREPAGLKSLGILDGLASHLDRALKKLPTVEGAVGLAGAAAPSAPGSFVDATFANAAGRRPYKLYVPTRYDAAVPLPLVVMLHGCTQSPDDFAAGTRMNEVAEAENFLVCYPAQTASANGSRCWNWFNDSDQHRDRGEPSIIAGITREVMAGYAADPRRIYVAGLSAGGALAATMGQAYPDLYAAVGVHSGLACGAARDMSSAFSAMRQGSGSVSRGAAGPRVPTIVFHGDGDTTVNPVNGDEVAAQILPAGALRRTVEDGGTPGGHSFRCTRYIDDDGRTVVEQWNVHGAGHAWAGGSPAGSYTDPRGPDASRAMWRFFSEHGGTATPAA